jgi:protein-S-isoprenylcysteine O-methyltransferase
MNISILISVVCSLWMISEVSLALFRRSKERGRSRDNGSIIWLNATVYSCVFLAVVASRFAFGQMSTTGTIVPSLGLCLILVGLGIRWTAILTLRAYFTTDVAIVPGQRLIRSGIYRTVRHPAYSGSIVSFCGLGLVLSSWLSLAVLLIPITGAFLRRIRIEEQVLETAFGTEYASYRTTSWQIVPWIW